MLETSIKIGGFLYINEMKILINIAIIQATRSMLRDERLYFKIGVSRSQAIVLIVRLNETLGRTRPLIRSTIKYSIVLLNQRL